MRKLALVLLLVAMPVAAQPTRLAISPAPSDNAQRQALWTAVTAAIDDPEVDPAFLDVLARELRDVSTPGSPGNEAALYVILEHIFPGDTEQEIHDRYHDEVSAESVQTPRDDDQQEISK